MVKAAKTIIFRRSENSPVREKRGFTLSDTETPSNTPPRSADYDWHDILKRDCAQQIKRCKKLGLPERVRTNTQAVLKEINQCNKLRQASFLKNLLVVGLGAQGLGPGPGPSAMSHQFFVVLKSWWEAGKKKETAETAAAEVGAKGYPPCPPPLPLAPPPRVSRL